MADVNQDLAYVFAEGAISPQQYEQQMAPIFAENPVAAPRPGASPENAFVMAEDTPAQAASESFTFAEDGGVQSAPLRDYAQLLSQGIGRNWAQMRAAPHTLSAIGSELSGDTAGMQSSMAQAQAIEQAAGQSQWSLQNIENFQDFTYWLTEKFGENAVTMLAAAGTGGAGALLGRGLATGLGASAAARAALIRAGTGTAIVGGATALETPGTAQEQYQVTGSTQPGMSIAAGFAKGLLEAYTPMRIFHALGTPGRQLGRTALGSAASVAVGEGATEFAQEAIDIALRKYSDPNYSFFGEGPVFMGEGAWRLAEATAAGTALGGIIGGPAAYLERRQELRDPNRPPPGGSREVVPLKGASEQIVTAFRGGTTDVSELEPRRTMTVMGMPATKAIWFSADRQHAGRYAEEKSGGSIHEADIDTSGFKTVDYVEEAKAYYVKHPQLKRDPALLNMEIMNEITEQAKNEEFKGIVLNNVKHNRAPNPVTNYAVFDASVIVSRVQLASVRVSPRGPVPSTAPVEPLGSKPGAETPVESEIPSEQMNMIRRTPEGFQPEAPANQNVGGRRFVPELTPAEADNLAQGFVRRFTPVTEEEIAQGYNYVFDIDVPVTQFGQTVRLRVRNRLRVPDDDRIIDRALAGITEMNTGGTDVIDRDTGELVLSNIEGVDSSSKIGRYAANVARNRHIGQPDRGESSQPIPFPRSTVGPVTEIRNMVMHRQGSPDTDLTQATTVDARSDLVGVSPLLRTLPSQAQEWMLDLIEANTTRYAVELPDGKFADTFLTNTDYEFESATKGVQSQANKVWRVDQGLLQPAGITATIFDLPLVGSGRVWFPKGVEPARQQSLLLEYQALQREVAVDDAMRFKSLADRVNFEIKHRPRYDYLTTEGLRVVPSRGSSFYYNLGFTGQVVEPRTSARSGMIGFFDIVNGSLFTSKFEERVANPTPGRLVPVSLDMNKFRPGEISALPEIFAFDEYTFREGISVEEKTRLEARAVEIANQASINGWTQQLIARFRQLMRDGIWIEPRYDQLAWITRDAIESNKLTPGVSILEVDFPERRLENVTRPETFVTNPRNKPVFKASKTEVVRERGYLGNNTNAVERSLKKLAALTDSILKSLHIEGGLLFTIAPLDMTRTWAEASNYTNRGEIQFHGPNVERGMKASGLGEKYMFNLVMHEVGHSITMHYFSMLPVEMQEKIWYAYNKALLLFSVAPEEAAYKTSTTEEAIVKGPKDNKYYLGFGEWLAEQFRRHATSDLDIRSELDRVYSGLGKQLEDFYKLVEDVKGEKRVMDLTRPDHYVTALFQYLRDYSSDALRLKQIERQQALYMVDEEVYKSPQFTQILKLVLSALGSMKSMIPEEGLNILFSGEMLNAQVSPDVKEGDIARALNFKDKALLELAIGALNTEQGMLDPRAVFAHELIHAYRMLGLITKQEMDILYQAAVKDKKTLRPEDRAALTTRLKEFALKSGMTEIETTLFVEDRVREETVAYYVQEFVNTGEASESSRTLLQRIVAIWEHVKEVFFGAGYRSRDQVLNAFFRGEMASRSTRMQQESALLQSFMRGLNADKFESYKNYMQVGEIRDVSTGLQVAIERVDKGQVNADRSDQSFATYVFFVPVEPAMAGSFPSGQTPVLAEVTEEREVIGILQIEQNSRGSQVVNNFSNQKGFSLYMQEYVQKDLGTQFLAPTTLTASGFRAFRRRYPEYAKYWIEDSVGGTTLYYSSKHVLDSIKLWTNVIAETKGKQARKDPAFHPEDMLLAQRHLTFWRGMRKKIPGDLLTTNKHLLEQMFMLERNFDRDGVQGAITRASLQTEENQLRGILGESIPPGSDQDAFARSTQEAMRESQARAARRAKQEFGLAAPEQAETMYMRKIIERIEGLEVSDKNKGYLSKMRLPSEADRIGWFTKIYWGLQQLLMRNEHIPGLRDYYQHTQMFNEIVSSWHRDAGDVARAWELGVTDPKRREEFSQLLFWLSEMKYLSPHERASGVVRHPTEGEYGAKLTALKLTPKEQEVLTSLYVTPKDKARGVPIDIFSQFINEVELAKANRIRATIHTPNAQMAAMNKLRAEMNELRAKPYFPMTRFGRFTISVRDPSSKAVLWFAAYDSTRSRDSALASVRARFRADEITIGTVPEAFFEFMGLPGPLLEAIKEEMSPALTPDQLAWLEDFAKAHVADQTFRSRWMTPSGSPGQSADAFRTFAHYFMNGSRYLARLAKDKDMSDAIQKTRQTIGEMANSSKRRMIVDYMVSHHKYVMESGRDYAKFKAFVALWQLGFSPAAAMMNLTQTPFVTLPYLMGRFGNAKATNQLLASYRAAKNLRNSFTVKGSGNYTTARLEAVRQGRIDIGLAAELGAFTEAHNLEGILAGTRAQKWLRNIPYYGMWMFQKAEQVNREVTFHAAWELAKANPTNERLKQIRRRYTRELVDLELRLSTPTQAFTREDAVAFLFAKEAVDSTQGIYAPWARPKFMQKPLAQMVLIFFQYIQLMTYVFRFNPGQVQLFLISAAMYGLLGLPGGDDLIEILTLVGKKLFGESFNLKTEMRRYARDLTRGTIFDQTGPDLLLHGLSRYGFGLGLLPEGWGLGAFDASGNGSLGKLIPGLYEGLHAINTRSEPRQFVNDVLQRLSGAGFGYAFNVAQWGMENQGSADSHTWERLMPRTVRAIIKAYRLSPAGNSAETTRSGAKIVRFDIADPEDLSAIITQALGLSPRRVTETWELIREQRDTLAVFNARRQALYGQFDYAIQSGRSDLREDVLAAIRRYNEEVRVSAPSMQITSQQIQQSVQGRTRARGMQEQLLPPNRRQVPVGRDIQDLFPGVRPQVVR